MHTQRTGKHAEDLALAYLLQQQLELRERNYSCRYGEIDLVMQDRSSVVFVEVRYRARTDFGGALESVDSYKQAKLTKSATHYLQLHNMLDLPARIDVFAMNALDTSAGSYLWVQNAVGS